MPASSTRPVPSTPRPPDFRPATANPIDEWFPHYFRAMAATYPVLLERCRAVRAAASGTIRSGVDRMRAAIEAGGGAVRAAARAADVLLSRALRGA